MISYAMLLSGGPLPDRGRAPTATPNSNFDAPVRISQQRAISIAK